MAGSDRSDGRATRSWAGPWSGASGPVAALLRIDGPLALALAAVQVAGAAADARTDGQPRLTAFAAALLVATAAPVALRRVHPVAVLAFVGALSAVYGARPYPDPLLELPLLVALFTVAAQCPRRTTVLVGAIGVVAALVSMLVSRDSGVADYYSTYLTVALAIVLGDRQRIRSERIAAVEARADEQDRRTAAEARQAAVAERSRIAREMHDVVAHHVSMVVVQAEAGAALADAASAGPPPVTPPDAAARFDAIAATGRDALTELRRVLGVLRDDQPGDGAPAVVPQPGLERLPALVADVRRAGQSVELRLDGDLPALPGGLDVAAYRIVQEALTNVVRHAAGSAAVVTVRAEPDRLALEVVDDGAGRAVDGAGRTVDGAGRTVDGAGRAVDGAGRTADGAGRIVDGAGRTVDGAGRGLTGIAERVAMCGGTVVCGPRPGGGFGVAVELPLATR